MRTRGDLLSFAIAFALMGARKLVRGLRQELTEEERYRVADDVVHRLKQHGDPWRLSEDLPPPGKTLDAVMLAHANRHLSRLLIVAILLISTTSLYAQGQQQNAAKLKADARNVVGTVANDKAKTQAYCQTLDLARQLERADEEKDRKKSKALSHMINQLQKLVGPEFFT